jgi:hypothetical protein
MTFAGVLSGAFHRDRCLAESVASCGACVFVCSLKFEGKMVDPALDVNALVRCIMFKDDRIAAMAATEYRGDINAISTASVYKCTPLTAAARYGKNGTLRVVLARGADESKEDGNGRSPLRVAAANDNGSLEILLELCPHLNVNKRDDVDGTTPLNRAAHFGMEGAVRLLLQLGAELDAKNNNGKNAEEEAIAEGHHTIATMIVEEVGEQMALAVRAACVTRVFAIELRSAFFDGRLGEGLAVLAPARVCSISRRRCALHAR